MFPCKLLEFTLKSMVIKLICNAFISTVGLLNSTSAPAFPECNGSYSVHGGATLSFLEKAF
jgi:hypothetical protein